MCAHCSAETKEPIRIPLQIAPESRFELVELCRICVERMYVVHVLGDPEWSPGPVADWAPFQVNDVTLEWRAIRLHLDLRRCISVEVRNPYLGRTASRILDEGVAPTTNHAEDVARRQWWRLTT